MARHAIVISVAAFLLCATTTKAADTAEVDARRTAAQQILHTAGIRGGLIVHVGCGDGRLTAALHAGDGYLVYGLDADRQHVDAARRHVRRLGLYGKVSVDAFDGKRLPLIDNLVNLLVAEDPQAVPMDEILRVLAPGGVACVRTGGAWQKTVKPWPDAIDQWTHFLHGPDNNAVAEDTVVGPPRRMQWLAAPQWTRHHGPDKGSNPGVRGVVSAAGRIFYLVDEATAANIKVPSQWFLVARDGFSGVRLWKKRLPVEQFARRLEQLWRGLVADGNRLYLPLATDGPLCALDATTGRVVRSYPGTEGMQELIADGDKLFAVIDSRRIVALATDTADVLWQWTPPAGVDVVPLTLAASDGHIFVKTDKSVCCLSAETGKQAWRFVPDISGARRRLNWPRAKLIATGGVVLCSYGGDKPEVLNQDIWEYLGSHPRVNEYGGTLAALSAADGKLLWKTAYRPGLESYPGDVFVIDGLVWAGPDFAEGRDLQTGEIRRRQDVLERLWTTGHHHRCYPEKATTRYILNGKRGVEMMDLTGSNHSRNNWVRGTCRIGVTPCNGLIYAPPHSCGCYMEAKLYGFWALAAESKTAARAEDRPIVRLEQGPAYGYVPNPKSPIPNLKSSAWPTYRHDPMRSGSTTAELPAELEPVWQVDVGGRVSPPVVAAGCVIVSDVDAHRIVCLDAQDGTQRWSFTTGGRVDSPPTIHAGRVLAGCADGCVYCLRLDDGQLIWRLLAAPQRINTVAFDQVESLWPVHGSVVVRGDVAYALAGRSSYLDGGMMLYGLDPATGKVLCKTPIRSEHAGAPLPPGEKERLAMDEKISQNATDWKTFTAPDRSDAFSMSGARTDVLVADADSVYLRHLRFDGDLRPCPEQRPHLFSTSDLLDGAEIHRSHWALGTGDFSRTPVAYSWIAYQPNKRGGTRLSVPYGLMLAMNEDRVWGVRRNHLVRPVVKQTGPYVLFGATRPDPAEQDNSQPDFRAGGVQLAWTAPLPLRPRAMIHAGDRLLVGGMSDRFDAKDPSAADNATFAGRGEGLLLVASSADGKTLAVKKLDAPPVWDGMAAAAGRLYVVDRRGRVVCLGR
ncbi:MAG: PQQ-binding-like beta-propeller repeat protein [Candidatus Nealsonbacteria bacterium]|nr:PQQ-binding-like beta-propeller repeat protein [Candidatus Nealsonbacteria bacterium]